MGLQEASLLLANIGRIIVLQAAVLEYSKTLYLTGLEKPAIIEKRDN